MADESSESKTENSGVVFRQAVESESAEEQVKTVPSGAKPATETVRTSPKSPPLSLYQAIRHRPFSADFFELGADWQHWNFIKEIHMIEDFVGKEIKTYGLTDSVESFKEVIENLESKIGRRYNERVWHRLDRLVSYIRAVKNVRKWQKTKDEFERKFSA